MDNTKYFIITYICEWVGQAKHLLEIGLALTSWEEKYIGYTEDDSDLAEKIYIYAEAIRGRGRRQVVASGLPVYLTCDFVSVEAYRPLVEVDLDKLSSEDNE